MYVCIFNIEFRVCIFLCLFYSFCITEAAILTGTLPFCSLLLECVLLNPLLLFKLSACDELNSFWLFLIRVFMGQTGRIPQKHISVLFEWKQLCRGILLNGGKWKWLGSLAASGLPSLPALFHSPSPECGIPGSEYQVLNLQAGVIHASLPRYFL